jgi:hypothetical protein
MEDLSHILVPKIPVTDGPCVMPVISQETMDGFSDAATIVMATELMGFAKEVVPDGSE